MRDILREEPPIRLSSRACYVGHKIEETVHKSDGRCFPRSTEVSKAVPFFVITNALISGNILATQIEIILIRTEGMFAGDCYAYRVSKYPQTPER